jgi:hypothetical protein
MEKLGFYPADISIPADTNNQKWSVVACDQYTSQPEYWQQVEDFVGDAPSTLRMIVPELYLEQPDISLRISKVNTAMNEYVENGILQTINGFLYVKRTLQNGKVRRGLMGVVDLECYDFSLGSQSLIRATEGTVLERIPPRVKVRENAVLECPHIMLLIDDPQKTVIEPLDKRTDLEKLYDFPLMQNSGALAGFLCDDAESARIFEALSKLADREAFNSRYGLSGKAPLLFAVGDGNHSLATAKTCYENLKKSMPKDEALVHPARYALVEIVNLHDTSLEFEPIHRVVFGIKENALEQALMKVCTKEVTPGSQKIILCKGKSKTILYFTKPSSNLPVGTLQSFLDTYIKMNGGKIDYIHGEDVVEDLSSKDGNLGFLLEGMPKEELFKTVVLDGSLPRKTFSMGHACDKRFYYECRRIK